MTDILREFNDQMYHTARKKKIIFVANILYQITSLLLTFGGAIAGISIGVIILVAVLGVERFKDRITRLVDYSTA